MQYVQTITPNGPRRLEIPNAIVAKGDNAIAKYVANPPANAVFVEALVIPEPAKKADEPAAVDPFAEYDDTPSDTPPARRAKQEG